MSQPKKRTGLLRALFALKHSFDGLLITWRTESAFRQEGVLAIAMIPAALFLPVAPIERAMLIGSVLLVLLVELLNSAIEAVVDRISLERHELSGRAKDCASAAVLIALVICAMTWATVLWPLGRRWLGLHA
jgi:diacylglycerol kinase (ATP)